MTAIVPSVGDGTRLSVRSIRVSFGTNCSAVKLDVTTIVESPGVDCPNASSGTIAAIELTNSPMATLQSVSIAYWNFSPNVTLCDPAVVSQFFARTLTV